VVEEEEEEEDKRMSDVFYIKDGRYQVEVSQRGKSYRPTKKERPSNKRERS
jgi:hypothetical protein